jgi:hypothetical protein
MSFEKIARQSRGVSAKIVCGWSLLRERVMMRTDALATLDEVEMISCT